MNLYLSSFLFLLSTCHILPCWSSDSSISLTLLPSVSLSGFSFTDTLCFLSFSLPSMTPHLHISSDQRVNVFLFFHSQIFFLYTAVNYSPCPSVASPLHPVSGKNRRLVLLEGDESLRNLQVFYPSQ